MSKKITVDAHSGEKSGYISFGANSTIRLDNLQEAANKIKDMHVSHTLNGKMHPQKTASEKLLEEIKENL